MSTPAHPRPPIPPLSLHQAQGAEADAIEAQVDAAMEAFNRAHLGDEQEARVVLVARDAQAPDAQTALAGALVAWVLWDYVYLENLWVAPERRGAGLGGRLLRQLEDLARARGLRRVQLFTFSFEAPGFYRKQGYTLAGQIPDAPTGTTNHWFYKLL